MRARYEVWDADAMDVRTEDALCHLVERVGSRYRAEVRVHVRVRVGKRTLEGERVVRVPVQCWHKLPRPVAR